MKLTKEIIKRGESGNGGWNKKQLSVLGISWPPKKGWQSDLIGRDFSEKDISLFIKLRGDRPNMFDKGMAFDYEAYTGGSCNNLSPLGEDGCAYIILKGGSVIKEASRGFKETTNNRMEMLAIISAMCSAPDDSTIVIHTDSQYCITALKKKYDHASLSKVKKNADLVTLFLQKKGNRTVLFDWVNGHDGNIFNERCNQLATEESERVRLEYGVPLYTVRNSPKVKTRQCSPRPYRRP